MQGKTVRKMGVSMNVNYEKQIEELMLKMTLEEKVGQLQQCGPSLAGAFEVSFEELLDMMFDGRISQEEFERLMSTAKQDFHEEDLKAGRIGSYNGIDNAAAANRLQKIAVEETRLGIPLIFGYDVIHGFRTTTPIPLAESCAWDEELWERTARIAAKEATAGGIHMTFAPMVDVAKDARWGRVSESAGEDVLLNSLYGAAKVRGFQGDDLTKKDALAACVKHFAAYGAGEAGRDYNRVDMSLPKLYEEYLPAYKACVDAGARAVMPAFNDVNGVPCSVNEWLLKDVLRKEWGFDGMTVSDANAIAECVNHGAAEDKRAAARQAIRAGMDMDMTSNSYIENLIGLVKDGEVLEEDIDRAVADVLRVKFELGLFEQPYKTDETREKEDILCREAMDIAREAAQKSMVLLKNENVLPLGKEMKLGVFGQLAGSKEEMTGAWAIGADTASCVSFVDGCKAKGISYFYSEGIKEGKICENEIRSIAAAADILVVAMGERKEQSGEAASRADITIDKEQMKLFEALKATKKPVAVILFNGRPLAIPELKENADAILEAWHPGMQAGNAIVDILFGTVNPSGKLTATFPYTTGQCPMYYAHTNTGRPGGRSKFTSKYLDAPLEPVYPFGYGLSYTEFEYSDLRAEQSGDKIVLKVTVKNVGKMDGDEIVQCYMQDVAAKRVRPVKQLKAFQKIFLKSGELAEIRFMIPVLELGYYDLNAKYIVESGIFRFYVGKNSEDVISKELLISK